MRKLKDTLRSFSKPDWTPEQWAAHDRRCREFEASESARKLAGRIERAGIPPVFADADLSLCDERVRAYASGGLGSGLLLQGTFGSGKTYAACAVLIAKAAESSVRFVLFDDLLRECRASFNGGESEEAVIGRYANAGVLCIDDLGKERLTEWSLPILFAIVNRRWERSKPTIVTTNYGGSALLGQMTVGGDSTTAKAIISRMCSYERVLLEDGDRRLA